MPDGREGRHTTSARVEPWCSVEDVLDGPVNAVLHSGAQLYRCRVGKSPKYELLRAVREDPELRRCLAFSDVSGSLEVSLVVDGEGRIEVSTEEDAPLELERCTSRLRLLRAMKLGCRWKVEVSLSSFSL